ncbi:MAG: DoxX family protein [Nitriliruptoraceae bacterium]
MTVIDVPASSVDIALLLLRLVVGIGVSLHGFQKLFGWFGGGGRERTAAWFASLGFGRGHVAATVAGVTEVCSGLGLAAGLVTPLAATGMIGVMTTAAFVNNDEAGFWSVNKGWELNLYLIAVAATLAIAGPGAWSLDAWLGLDRFAGPVVGAVGILVGVAGGTLRWRTRSS